MKQKARETWEAMRHDPPGERFQRHYHRRRQRQERSGRIKLLALSAVLIAGGILLLFVPGPGAPLIALGAALLAEESLVTARALDWTEVQIRRLFAWGRRLSERTNDRPRR